MTNTQLDEMAARAMVGLLSGPLGKEFCQDVHLLAKGAYEVADAMAEEKRRRDREKLDPTA